MYYYRLYAFIKKENMLKFLTTIIGLLIIKDNYHKNRFLSSVTVYIGCYLLIFVLFPLSSDIVCKNAQIIDVYSFWGIIMYWLGTKMIKDKSNIPLYYPQYRKLHFGRVIYIYCVVFLISMFLFVKNVGISRIKLVLAGDLTGKEIALGGDVETTVYGYFSNLMIPLILILVVSAINRKQKILGYLALASYVAFTIAFGFTRIFTISALAIVVFFKVRYLPTKKQLIYSLFGAISLLFLLVSMNFFRCMGIGEIITADNLFDLGYILESSDFGASYVWFDKLLSIEPPYIRLDTYLKPILYVFIPRSIWPDKPEQTSMQILKILDPSLASTGFSTAGYSVLGEGYAMLGYIGLFLFPFIWGLLCQKFDTQYYRRLNSGYDNCIQNLFYYIFAVFIILCCQRGDWNQYLFMVIWFFYLPIYLLSKKERCQCVNNFSNR